MQDHTDKPSTRVLTPSKLGALREVACDNNIKARVWYLFTLNGLKGLSVDVPSQHFKSHVICIPKIFVPSVVDKPALKFIKH